MRYHRVLARSDLDGLYYPALVNKYVNERYVSVCFDNGENQLTSVRYVVSIGGSAPCPSLSVRLMFDFIDRNIARITMLFNPVRFYERKV